MQQHPKNRFTMRCRPLRETTGHLLGHSLCKIRDTYVHLGSEGIMAMASQETADWVAAAMAGKSVKPGVKVAREEKTRDVTA